MGKRRVAMGLAALLCVSLAGWHFLMPPSSEQGYPVLSLATVEKVQRGMTEKEVSEVLGAAPGDYTNGRFKRDAPLPVIIPMNPPYDQSVAFEQEWVSDKMAVVIQFDSAGRACGSCPYAVERSEPTLWDVLRRLYPW